ncbi:MAG: YqaJ viral recombinase family protein [Neisseriaceae bacterium]|nr:YqaJ viral recombinase family protein [Neisseriaceae bacterium]
MDKLEAYADELDTAEVEQRTDEWQQVRCGKITASRMGAVMNVLKNGTAGAERRKYTAELVCERLTGNPTPHYENAAMQHGTELEPIARDAYWLETGNEVEEVGFIEHPSIPNCGASPDGLIGDDGLIEIKAPETYTHIETLRTGEIKQDYIYQMQWQMECCSRKWCDFVSFDNRLPEKLQIFIKRVYRDDALIDEMKNQVWAVNAAVDTALRDLEKVAEKQGGIADFRN